MITALIIVVAIIAWVVGFVLVTWLVGIPYGQAKPLTLLAALAIAHTIWLAVCIATTAYVV